MGCLRLRADATARRAIRAPPVPCGGARSLACGRRVTRDAICSSPVIQNAEFKMQKDRHRAVSAFCTLNSELLRIHRLSENTPTSEAHMLRHVATGRYLDRAVLELGNLPERIEHRVGQHVRCRFVVAERDEHRPAWCAFV